MPLSWNEIKSRAITFTKKWKDEVNEHAESKSFWDDFFNVFGISRKRVASFEQPVKKIDERQGFIDLLWKGMILVEHKSRGKDLIKAYQQARDYFPGLTEKELPRYILVSDFERFHLYDLEENTSHEFKLNDFVSHVNLFGFIAGYEKRTFREQDPVNIEAAALMGKLHDKLKTIGYTGHSLELYLVRLLFCLFADDSNIFERGILYDYIDQRTDEDGSDLANHIAQLFEVLNTPKDKRYSNLDESLAAFPYVNGKLFEEHLPIASFDSDMRRLLLECCGLDWGKISPAIFGSLFQSVMNPVERRNLGAHYTSEKNILKLIKPLFLDELWKEFGKAKERRPKLQKFHNKLRELRFLDPACGCGNFLIIAYRELRLLEIEVIKILLKENIAKKLSITNIDIFFLLDVDQFYGIEYEEFPAQIAQVAMWLIDHQMNMKASETFGEYYVRLPLKKSAVIKHGNALRTEWQSLIDPLPWEKGEQKFDYIFGNPPFSGSKVMSETQRNEIKTLFYDVQGAGVLDYVTGWYILATRYINQYNNLNKNSSLTKVAFVSTNSISQGEQVGILWNELLNKYNVKIHFAHQTFKWRNEAKGVAAVYCIIVGFSNFQSGTKLLYQYENIKTDAHEIKVSNINPYLVEGKDVVISKRSIPICFVPKISFGNMPLDGGNLLLTNSEKNEFLINEPKAEKFIKKRWCLWLVNAQPNELKELPLVLERIKKVKEFRLNSIAPSTVKFASTPGLFRDRQTPETYIVIPSTTSENRKYIPLGFFTKDEIANNSTHIIPLGNMFHFGVLTSEMHMAWIKYVCGRLESRFRYSKDIVYNNFPWPENPTEKQKQTVETAAQNVLDVRAKFPESSLADLYDPTTMPPELVKAHQALDKAVDLCYRPQPFINETKRIEFLFELYDKLTRGMFGGKEK